MAPFAFRNCEHLKIAPTASPINILFSWSGGTRRWSVLETETVHRRRSSRRAQRIFRMASRKQPCAAGEATSGHWVPSGSPGTGSERLEQTRGPSHRHRGAGTDPRAELGGSRTSSDQTRPPFKAPRDGPGR